MANYFSPQRLTLKLILMKNKFTEPNNWSILNDKGHIDIKCNSTITVHDRDVIQEQFHSAYMCIPKDFNRIHITANNRKHCNRVIIMLNNYFGKCSKCKKVIKL